MANASADVELRIKLRDKSARDAIDRYARHVENAARRAERATRDANARTERSTQQSTNRQRSSYERLSHARAQLGIRSEHEIRREMQRTEAAYQRLARSGTASQRELSRAAEQTRRHVERLTNEMGRQTREQERAARAARQLEQAQSRLRAGVAVGAGLLAGGYVLRAPIQKALNWQERLAYIANTAYAERDVAGRVIGTKQLEAVINRVVDSKQGGGGTREQAAEALDAMIARSVLGTQRSIDFLPTVMRTAYGNNAAPIDIANLASGLVAQNVVASDAELKTALNMITAAGQAGGFEIKDLARWLPEQLAVGKTAGLVGLSGLQRLLTLNETSLITASDTSQAGNNVANLLAKLSSVDTAKDFAKAGGGDLTEFLIKQQAKGVDSITAWMGLIDKTIARDPALKKAMADLDQKGLSKEDRQQRLDSIAQLSEGGIIGRFFQDRQARAALFSLRLKDEVERIGGYIAQNRTEYGANDLNYQTLQGTGAAAVRNAEQELAIRQQQAMEKLIPAITKAADLFVDLSKKYPDLSAAVIGAGPPIVALGVAAGVSAMALGGGAAGGSALRVAGLLGGGLQATGVGALGYAAGHYLAKPGIDALVQWGTGNDHATLGTALYDWWNKPGKTDPTAKFEGQLMIEVAPGFEVRRKSATLGDTDIAIASKTHTGNLFTGAP